MNETSKEITISVPGTIIAFLFEILLPVILSIIWMKYFYNKISCILVGIAGFVASVFIEKYIFLLLIFLIAGYGVFYYIILGLSPGLFEETGRYICFKILLSNQGYNKKEISIGYGIGHGGIESIYIGIQVLSILLTKDKLIENGSLTVSIPFFQCLMSAIERLSAVIFHISASIFVYKAVKEKKIIYYIIAIVLHDLVDLFALLYQLKILKNIYILELFFAIFSCCMVFFAYKLYNSLESDSNLENTEENTRTEDENLIGNNN